MKKVEGTPLVLGVDPGGTTGWAVFDPESGGCASGEVEGRINCYHQIRSFLSTGRPFVVAYEPYRVTAKTVKMSRQYDAFHIIGALEFLCETTGIPFYPQPNPKTFSTDDKLRCLGWWHPTENGHANDATRVLLAWLVEHHPAGLAVAARLAEGLPA